MQEPIEDAQEYYRLVIMSLLVNGLLPKKELNELIHRSNTGTGEYEILMKIRETVTCYPEKGYPFEPIKKICESYAGNIQAQLVSLSDKNEYNQIKPEHYKAGGSDVIAFAQYHGLGFEAGNVVKYVTRAGKKPNVPELVDLHKAREYLNRLIEAAEARAE